MTETPGGTLRLRDMRADDLPRLHALSRAVGWPHRTEDWRLSFELGEGLVALAGEEPVGTVMWWRYGGTQARIGFVIVSPAVQRSGLGRRLMQACLARVEAATIVLNSTAAGLALYQRLGFVPLATIEQHQGIVDATKNANGSLEVRPLTAAELDAAIALDAAAIGAPRPDVVRRLAEAGAVVAVGAPGTPAAVAFCRPFGRGHVVGPVVAPDRAHAETLVAYWLDRHAGDFVRIDTPPALGLAPCLARFGLARVDTVTTMARGPAPPASAMRTFALASHALG
jgi:hypothetical protein